MLIAQLLTILAMFLALFLQILPDQLVVLFVPILVWLASGAVNWLKAKLAGDGFGGTVLVTLVVPVLSYLASLVVEALAEPQTNFWIMFLLGLVGVFINEMVKQWTQSAKGVQTKAKKQLIG